MAHDVSKKKLGERVLRIINAGKDTLEQKVKIQDCELAVAQARDKILLDSLMLIKQSEELTYIPLDWLSEKEVIPIKKGDYLVAKLPSRPLTLFNNNIGIYSVHPTSDDTREIIPVSPNFRRMYARQAAGTMQNKPYYVPYQQELRIYNIKEEDCPITVLYVQAGEYFDSGEFFCIPPELQNDVVVMALEILGYQKQSVEDPITDAKG